MEKDLDISKSANRHLRNICESQRKNGSTNDPTNSMCHYLDLSEASLYEKIQERQTKRFSNLSLTENSNQTSNKSTWENCFVCLKTVWLLTIAVYLLLCTLIVRLCSVAWSFLPDLKNKYLCNNWLLGDLKLFDSSLANFFLLGWGL